MTYRLTAKRKAEIVDKFQSGQSIANIAGYYGGFLSRRRVEQVLREAFRRRKR